VELSHTGASCQIITMCPRITTRLSTIRVLALNRIYTKRGDTGETGPCRRPGRVAKDSLRIEAYGTVDELNSFTSVAQRIVPGTMRTGPANGPARRDASPRAA